MVVQKGKKRPAVNAKSNPKSKNKKYYDEKVEDEEISSEFEEDDIVEDVVDEKEQDSSDEDETEQDKKFRLTKEYLEKLKAYRSEADEDDKDVVGDHLQEEVLKNVGKLQKPIADKCKKPEEASIKLFKGHRSTVTAVVVSSDFKFIYSASKDCSIIKWSLENKKSVIVVKGGKKFCSKTNHIKIVLALALSTDNKFLASSGLDKFIHIWDGETLKHIHVFHGHRASVSGLSFRMNSHELFSSSMDQTVKVWNLDVMGYVETLFGHQNNVIACDSFIRDRCVTVGGADGTMRIWKIPEESQLVYHSNKSSSLECVRFINEEHLITGDDNASVCLWNVNKKKPIVSMKTAHLPLDGSNQPSWISAVGALRNSDLVATGSCDGFIRVWKCTKRFVSLIPIFEISVKGFINDIQITEDGHLVAAVGQEHRLGRWFQIKKAKNHIFVAKIF